jgi:hypothetical protein
MRSGCWKGKLADKGISAKKWYCIGIERAILGNIFTR